MEYRYSYTENCIFKGNCVREDKTGCDAHCTIQPEFYYLFATSNIPEQYKKKVVLYPDDEDLDAFYTLKDIADDIDNFVKDGRILYLWSNNVGNSKTTWACKLLKLYLANVCIGNTFKDRAWFTYVPSFLLTAKEFNEDVRREQIQAVLTRDLVVLDDIGSVNLSNYDTVVLSDVINTRYSRGLATIYTSNISDSDIYRQNARLADRICSDIVIELKGSGRRQSTNKYKRRDNM